MRMPTPTADPIRRFVRQCFADVSPDAAHAKTTYRSAQASLRIRCTLSDVHERQFNVSPRRETRQVSNRQKRTFAVVPKGLGSLGRPLSGANGTRRGHTWLQSG